MQTPQKPKTKSITEIVSPTKLALVPGDTTATVNVAEYNLLTTKLNDLIDSMEVMKGSVLDKAFLEKREGFESGVSTLNLLQLNDTQRDAAKAEHDRFDRELTKAFMLVWKEFPAFTGSPADWLGFLVQMEKLFKAYNVPRVVARTSTTPVHYYDKWSGLLYDKLNSTYRDAVAIQFEQLGTSTVQNITYDSLRDYLTTWFFKPTDLETVKFQLKEAGIMQELQLASMFVDLDAIAALLPVNYTITGKEKIDISMNQLHLF